MHWMLLPLKRYAQFSGRSRRMEYWMFALFQILLVVAVMVIVGVAALVADNSATVGGIVTLLLGLYCLFILGLIIPSLAVQVRRFHGIDMSGWSVFLGFIPIVGGIIVLVLLCKNGTPGDNRFGPNPRETENIGDVFA